MDNRPVREAVFDYIKALFPAEFKGFIKSHPSLANTIDRLFHNREIGIYTGIRALLSPNEMQYLYQLAKAVRDGIIVEIGCYAGGSAYFLGQGALKSNSLVYCIDPFNLHPDRQRNGDDGSFYCEHPETKPSKAEVEENMKRHGLETVVNLLEGFSHEVAQIWDNGTIGLLWIDGDHNQAYEDFYAWRIHLGQGATVAFHDSNYPIYGREDVSSAVLRIIEAEKPAHVNRVDSISSFTLS